jgi:PAS domain S-box-containing protein
MSGFDGPANSTDGGEETAGAGAERGDVRSRIELALDAGAIGVWEFDVGDDTVSVRSPQHDRLFGYDEPPDAWSVERFFDHLHPEDRERVEESFEAALASGEWSCEFRIQRADGDQRWLAADGAVSHDDGTPRRAVGIVRDVTDRRRLDRDLRTEREHLRVALENSPFTAFRLDTDLRYTWIGGAHDDFDSDAVIGKRDDEVLPPEPAERIMGPKRRALEADEAVREVVTYELPSGSVTYDLTVEPLREDGEVIGLTCAALDITERTRLERTLVRLHEASRDIVAAATPTAAAERIVDAAVGALGVDAAVVYLLDQADNVLRPVAPTDGLRDLRGEVAPEPPGGSPIVWRAFANDETVSLGESAGRGGVPDSVESGLWIPLADHGVLALAAGEREAFDEETRRVAEHLAATAEATLDRIAREAAVEARERQLAEQNRRLEGLGRINDIIREIDRELVRATSVEEIEAAVCERLTREGRFAFAWFGERDGEGVTPRAWAGDRADYLDDVSLELSADGGDPAVESVASGDVTHVADVVETARADRWRRTALACGYRSIIATPVRYDGVDYGVLAVYDHEADAFGPLTRDVLAELSDTVARALNAAETRLALGSDAVVEVELDIRAVDTALGRLATEADTRLDVHGAVPAGEGATQVFFSSEDDLEAALGDAVASTSMQSFERLGSGSGFGDRTRYEVTVGGVTIPTALARSGARARRVRIDDGGATVAAELPRSADVREFLGRVKIAFPETELVARHDGERLDRPASDPTEALEGLTDRQREVLRTAYLSGYFERPRDRTGEEVAESLGISQSTFNGHLRRAEQTLYARIFDGDSSVG